MKKILLSILVLSVLASTAMAALDDTVQVKDGNGNGYSDINFRGVDVSSGITTSQVAVVTGNAILVDIFVVTATTGTTGTVYLRNNSGTRQLDISVGAVAATAAKSRSIWSANNLPPLRMAGDWNGIDVFTSTTDITAYVGYIKQ